MKSPIQILLLEDADGDALLIEHELRRAGIAHTMSRVADGAGFRAALAGARPDVVLSDYKVPGFRGDAALAVVREISPELPFLCVSGTIGEDLAVELMKAGATDYVLKDRLERLPLALRRALDEAEQRAARRQAEAAARRSNETLALALDASALGTWDWNITTGELEWSERCKAIYGIPAGEPMNYGRFIRAIHPDDRRRADAAMTRALAEQMPYDIEYRTQCPDGAVHWISSKGRAFYDAASGKPMRMTGTALEITERKRSEEEIRTLNRELESRVIERTSELRAAVDALEREMAERRRLEAEVLRIAEQERLHVASDLLHEGVCQELVGTQLLLSGLRQDLENSGHPQASHARSIEEALLGATDHALEAARGLNPVVAEGNGLMHALEKLAAATQRAGPMRCSLECPAPVWIENQPAANALYRIAQEAIRNAVRHSHAAQITVHLSEGDGEVCLTVQDDGGGLPADVSAQPGMGLPVMRYRAGLLGGQFTIQPREAGGTEVVCRIPKLTAKG